MSYKIDKNKVLVKVKLNKKSNRLVLPNKITSIGNSAFAFLDSLIEINIPSSVTDIESKAFYACSRLEKVLLPENIEKLNVQTFSGCVSLKEIDIPDGVTLIESDCFSSCYNLSELRLPTSLQYIGRRAFFKAGIESIDIPNGVSFINDQAFKNCSDLKKVKLPNELEILGERVFDECPRLKTISLPNSLKKLGEGCFEWCTSLDHIVIPQNITQISDNVFYNCLSLKDIKLHDNITSIGADAFCRCESLSEIKLPSRLTELNNFVFYGCENLKHIIIPEEVISLGSHCFASTGIENIIIPEKILSIGEKCFSSCKQLKSIKLPSTLKRIEAGTFLNCVSLENLNLPDSVEIIGSQAFENCKKIESIILPNSLKKINNRAFAGSSIKDITIPASVEYIGEKVFSGCQNLNTVRISNYSLLFSKGILELVFKCNKFYYDKNSGEIVISTSQLNDNNLQEIKYRDVMEELNCTKSNGVIVGALFNIDQINSSRYIKDVLNTIFVKEHINIDNHKEFSKNILNHKEFDLLCKRVFNNYNDTKAIYCSNLLNLSYSLGIFNDNKIERQRACEFLSNAFENKKLSMHMIHGSFESLKFKGFNKEWSEFFFNKENFEKLLELEKEETGFIAKIYNNFEKIKEFSRSNRGSQRYRKITIDMCKKYFVSVKFENVDEDNLDIADELAKYTRDQSSFDKAVEIRQEYLHLREIKNIRDQIIEDINQILNDLSDVANEELTSEFLSKYDPLNFTLGKYCSCCAHIEGEGRGIMKASILHPNCQNLVIRNKKGEIIAKSTLYINRSQGYGVFNNVEINQNIKSEEVREKIYRKYVETVRAFAIKYNKDNPNNPLTQINVGMGLNDLSVQIEKNSVKSKEILQGIDFSQYGGYDGDWQHEQYIVWKDDRVKNR